MNGTESRRRRKILRLSQIEVARRTGLANSSISRFESDQIPYYYGRDKLEEFYKSEELKETERLIGRESKLAQAVIIERLPGKAENQTTQIDWFLRIRMDRMGELLELHPREFLEIYDRTVRMEGCREAA